MTEPAARKRLTRAVERFRQVLSKSGEPTLSAAVVEQVIRGGLHHASPALRAATIHAAAGAGTSAAGVSIAQGVTILMALAKAKTVAIGVLLALLLLGGGTLVTWKVIRPRGNQVVVLPTTGPSGDGSSTAFPDTQPSPGVNEAWSLYEKAAAIIEEGDRLGMSSPAASAAAFGDHPPFSPQWHRMAKQAYEHNLPALIMTRQARSLAVAGWPRISTDGKPDRKYLNRCRNIANEIADAALYQHEQGNDAQAIEFVRDELHLADLLDAGKEELLIESLVAAGIRASALNRLEVITSNVSLTADPADRRRLQISAARDVIHEVFTNADSVEHLNEVLSADNQTTLTPEQKDRAATQVRRAQMERNLAAMSLACHVYRFEKSRWPASLADLQPYLPAAPTDAWGPMGYVLVPSDVLGGSPRPLVYSRCMSKDGMFYRTDGPHFGYYAGDGSRRPADQRKEGGQFRDVTLWVSSGSGSATRPLQ